jgi:hypothetical protein
MRVRVQSALFGAIPGGGVASDVIYFLDPSAPRQVAGQMRLGSPTPIINTILEEGVDFPFYTRSMSAWGDTPQAHWRRGRQTWLSQGGTSGLSLSILSIPPDPFPLQVSKVTEVPVAWNVKRLLFGWHAGQRTAPGSWAPIIPASSYTDTDSCRIMNEIQRHMLEAVIDDGQTWDLWTAEEVRQYFNQRTAQFLREAELLYTRSTTTVTAGTTSVNLPADLISLIRAVWNSGSARTPLFPIDSRQLDAGRVGWQNESGTPQFRMMEPQELLKIRLTPTPNANGTIEWLYVAAPEQIQATCSSLVLPNLFVPYVKWGVIADMLKKEGEANDPERAEYAEARFQEGIELAKLLVGERLGV